MTCLKEPGCPHQWMGCWNSQLKEYPENISVVPAFLFFDKEKKTFSKWTHPKSAFPKKSSHYFIHFSTVIWEQDSGTGQRHWKKEKEEEIVRKIVKETKRENIWILPLNIVASFIKPWKICFIFHLIQKYFRAFSKVGLMTVMFSFHSFFSVMYRALYF